VAEISDKQLKRLRCIAYCYVSIKVACVLLVADAKGRLSASVGAKKRSVAESFWLIDLMYLDETNSYNFR